MELYIGGRAQGKLAYVKKVHEGECLTIVEGPEMTELLEASGEISQGWVVWNHFHRYVWQHLRQDPAERETFLLQVLERFPKLCVISDEVGCGIVPVEEIERLYRDETGRLLCILAGRADRMERVICQIGQRIK
ncbi:MAG: bifunctional adenosylcobinamide kinase/adenosylcobinamide-phosphate guanylyltransferase [Roseburia sp.]